VATFTDVSGAPVDLRGNMIQVMLNTMATSAPAVVYISAINRTTPGVTGWVSVTSNAYNVQIIGLFFRMGKKSLPAALETIDI
jgi:hypothetical protein